jgi:hypothetical protein
MNQMIEENAGRQAIANDQPRGMRPPFILRLGYLAQYHAPVSLRRPVDGFVRT